jgi:hypothetical protein
VLLHHETAAASVLLEVLALILAPQDFQVRFPLAPQAQTIYLMAALATPGAVPGLQPHTGGGQRRA